MRVPDHPLVMEDTARMRRYDEAMLGGGDRDISKNKRSSSMRGHDTINSSTVSAACVHLFSCGARLTCLLTPPNNG